MVDADKNPDPDVYKIDQSTVEFNCVYRGKRSLIRLHAITKFRTNSVLSSLTTGNNMRVKPQT